MLTAIQNSNIVLNSDQQHVSAEARSVLVTPSVPDSELRSSDTSMQTLPLPLPQ